MGNFLKEKLAKTRESIFGRIKNLLSGKSISREISGEIEEILVSSDISIKTASKIIADCFIDSNMQDRDQFIRAVKMKMLSILHGASKIQTGFGDLKPLAIMVVGVNGVGKTTTIGKIAKHLLIQGKSGIVAACDTFRAAATEQLEILADKAGVRVITQKTGADPASVAFDALRAARSAGSDFLILDTAGRLHTKRNLMEELKKVKRVLGKDNGNYPQEVWLVLDATLGQNSLAQVKEFNEAIGLTGIIMAKMDGTAKGGMLLTIASEYSIPIKYIGVGEGMEDLLPFDASDFVEAIFS